MAIRKTPSRDNKDNDTALFSNKAYASLRKMILGMEVGPKEPLSESKLVAMLGMSRTPIREALRRLVAEGIAISYGKKGCFPNIPTLKEIKDLYEVRMIMERGSVELAVDKIDLDRLDYFERQFTQQLRMSESAKENVTHGRGNGSGVSESGLDLVKLGREFHFFIINSAGNEKLTEFLQNIYDRLDLSRSVSYQRRGVHAVEEHLGIIKALKKRDGEGAQRLIMEHLRKAVDTLAKIL